MTERCGWISASSGESLPLRDELGDERVVVGQLLDLLVADQIGARVADVAERDDAVLDERDGDRRAHAGGVRILCGAVEDLPVRLLDERDDPLLAAAVDALAERGRRHA